MVNQRSIVCFQDNQKSFPSSYVSPSRRRRRRKYILEQTFWLRNSRLRLSYANAWQVRPGSIFDKALDEWGAPLVIFHNCKFTYNLFFKWAIPGLFLIHFRLSKHITNFAANAYVKNVRPVYSVGIKTHNLWSMSLLPYPIDRGYVESRWLKSIHHWGNSLVKKL